MKDTETRTRITTVRKGDESEGLPRAASWANKPRESLASAALHNNTTLNNSHSSTSGSAVRPPKRPIVTTTRSGRSGSTAGSLAELKTTTTRKKDKEKTPSIASSSRPATPASASLPNRPVTPASTKASKPKETAPPPPPPPVAESPALSTAVASDVGSGAQESSPVPSPPHPKAVQPTPPESATNAPPAVPPGIPAVPPGLAPPPGLPASPALSAPPPGLTPPPGLPPPSRQPPQLATHPSQSSYQMSAQAQQLLEDVRSRRESAFFPTTSSQNPFPDFDRMLQNLTDSDSGFSFNLDPKLVGKDADASMTLTEIEAETNKPFMGTFIDAFPALRQPGFSPSFATLPPPGLGFPNPHPVYKTTPQSVERQSSGSSYTGSFNPFAESADDTPAAPARRFSPLDEDRKMSRFGFARGRQGSSSSPLATASPLSHSESIASSFYTATSTGDISHSVNQSFNQWNLGNRHHTSQADYIHSNAASTMSSPLVPQAQAQANSMYQNHQHQQQLQLQQQLQQHQQAQAQASRFQPFEASVSEAQLRELISQSRDRMASSSRMNGRCSLFLLIDVNHSLSFSVSVYR